MHWNMHTNIITIIIIMSMCIIMLTRHAPTAAMRRAGSASTSSSTKQLLPLFLPQLSWLLPRLPLKDSVRDHPVTVAGRGRSSAIPRLSFLLTFQKVYRQRRLKAVVSRRSHTVSGSPQILTQDTSTLKLCVQKIGKLRHRPRVGPNSEVSTI